MSTLRLRLLLIPEILGNTYPIVLLNRMSLLVSLWILLTEPSDFILEIPQGSENQLVQNRIKN